MNCNVNYKGKPWFLLSFMKEILKNPLFYSLLITIINDSFSFINDSLSFINTILLVILDTTGGIIKCSHLVDFWQDWFFLFIILFINTNTPFINATHSFINVYMVYFTNQRQECFPP